MFPLERSEEAIKATETDVSSSNFHIPLQPKNGSHTENYTIYRTSSIIPPVLHRMTQRGAAVIGVEEETLRSSIRWIESKLNIWRTKIKGSAKSSDLI